jgi:hypothetical protein
VLCLDSTFLRKGIQVPIRPVYRKLICTVPDGVPDVIADIKPNITYPLSQQTVV